MARVSKDAYRQGLRDSLREAPTQPAAYDGNTTAHAVARRSWKLGLAHGAELMAAAREFEAQTQNTLGAAQQALVDAAFMEKVGACLEVAI